MEPWNFEREKAFNMAVSKYSTQCCVCSLFNNPNLFSFFKPKLVAEIYKELMSDEDKMSSGYSKPITELRVVVQRGLVDIPRSFKGTSPELDSCTAGSGEEDDNLITCSSCAICVHRCEK
jgi:hypothetical protein